MGIKRRRKKLSNTISSLERRIKAVEFRPIDLLTTAQINAVIEAGTIAAEETFFRGTSAPNTYIRVEDAYYYPKRLTGLDNDYVEVYTQGAVNGLSTNDRVEISGVHGTLDQDIDVSSDNFKLLDKDDSPWDGRESYEHNPAQDQDPGVTIGYSYSVVPEGLAPASWSDRRRLETKFAVSTFSITDTTVTVVTESDHKFKIDDVIFTNMNSDSSNNQLSATAYGADGIFIVTNVTSNTLQYSLTAGVDTPTGTITPVASVYVYPTIRNWCRVGDTWIDTSTDPNTTYYWTGLRWAEFTASTPGAGADSIAPASVTNVSVVTENSGGYTDGSGNHRARVTLEWDAPEQDAEGNDLTDLAGYEVWASYFSSDNWTKSGLLSTETTYTVNDLDPAVTVYFRIFAVDASLNRSVATNFSTTTGTFAGILNPPSAPICTSDLGVVTAKWNGLDNTGVNMNPSVRYIETHVSVNENFTTSNSTIVASMAAGTNNYSNLYQYNDGFGTLVQMDYGTTYWFKFVAVDSAGNKTAGSTATGASIAQVDGAAIQAGAISAKILAGETITATSPSSSYQIELNANYLRAVNKTNGTETFRMNTSTGAVQIGAGITNTTINGSAITVSNLSASAITTGTLNAGAITVTNLSATSITTGTLNGTNVSVTNLSASSITTGSFSGDRVSGGTITGTTISGGTLNTTAVSSRSVSVSGSKASFLYNGTEASYIQSNTGGGNQAPKLELYSVDAGTGFGVTFGDGGLVCTNASLGTFGIYTSGNESSTALFAAGGLATARGVSFGSTQWNGAGHTLTVQNSRLESSGNFRAAADLNVGGEIYYAAPTSSTSGQPIHRNTGTNRLYGFTSAARFKKNIQEIQVTPEMIDTFLSVPIKQFNPIEDDSDLVYGLIAEDLVNAGFDNLVVYEPVLGEDGTPTGETVPLTLDFYSINALGQHIIRQQQSRISEMENTLSSLISRLEALEGN